MVGISVAKPRTVETHLVTTLASAPAATMADVVLTLKVSWPSPPVPTISTTLGDLLLLSSAISSTSSPRLTVAGKIVFSQHRGRSGEDVPFPADLRWVSACRVQEVFERCHMDETQFIFSFGIYIGVRAVHSTLGIIACHLRCERDEMEV